LASSNQSLFKYTNQYANQPVNDTQNRTLLNGRKEDISELG